MTDNVKTKLSELLNNTGDMALKRRARRIIEELDPRNGDKILDLGCGDGYYSHILLNLDLKLNITGSDFDVSALGSARRNLKGKKVNLVWGNLMKKLPFKDNNFDKIVMSEVAEHLPDDVKCLKEVRRVLKPKGILCLTVPNHNYPIFWDPVNWILEHFFKTHIKTGFWAGLWNMHIRLYTPEQITKVLERAGFKIEKLEALTFWALPFSHNIIHLGARMLHSGKLDITNSDSINKFKLIQTRPWYINAFFKTVNLIDKLNDIWVPCKDWGVGIFVKAVKE